MAEQHGQHGHGAVKVEVTAVKPAGATGAAPPAPEPAAPPPPPRMIPAGGGSPNDPNNLQTGSVPAPPDDPQT